MPEASHCLRGCPMDGNAATVLSLYYVCAKAIAPGKWAMTYPGDAGASFGPIHSPESIADCPASPVVPVGGC